jgi:hypothetical protein
VAVGPTQCKRDNDPPLRKHGDLEGLERWVYFILFRNDGQSRFREGQFRDRGAWRVVSDRQFCSAPRIVDVDISVLRGDPQNIASF